MMDDKTRIFEAIIYPLSDFFFIIKTFKCS